MKVSDYIVEYLIQKGITDAFGYPGGMVTHLMDSFAKYQDKISAHAAYHEQAAAFAACGYAQASGKPGIAYATSGPGATNLVTGICNAFFDSIPLVCITGQVNSDESKGSLGVRQRGFQETDIVSMVKPVAKYAAYVESADKIKHCLDRAFEVATSGRMGPALLDIPMNVFREEVDESLLEWHGEGRCSVKEWGGMESQTAGGQVKLYNKGSFAGLLKNCLEEAERPCILLGNGIKLARCQDKAAQLAQKLKVPVVTSMVAFDVAAGSQYHYGFIGAYGDRAANFIVAKSDLIISLGSRLDVRQVGAARENFAPGAKLIRIDVDAGELGYPVHVDEAQACMEIEGALEALDSIGAHKDYSAWVRVCDGIKSLLEGRDRGLVHTVIEAVSGAVPENTVVTTDVGQNQVWVAQAFKLKKGQAVLFSGGHGAMGYSLPAAIGACYASGKRPVVCIAGDGGMQMNIQELQFIAREKLPVKVVVLNNGALGMIRHFQEMYFDRRYFQTKPEGGYSAPDFSKVALAYGIQSRQVGAAELKQPDGLYEAFSGEGPFLLEVLIKEDTYAFPKLEFGKPNQDQEPLLERGLYERIMGMDTIDRLPSDNPGGYCISYLGAASLWVSRSLREVAA